MKKVYIILFGVLVFVFVFMANDKKIFDEKEIVKTESVVKNENTMKSGSVVENEKNEDLFFKYHLTPSTKPGVGFRGTTIEIKNNEISLFRDYPFNNKKSKKIKISDKTKNEFFDFIKSFDLFSKKESYSVDKCFDGKVEDIVLKINGEEKKIQAYCGGFEESEKIGKKLLELFGEELEIKSVSGF